MSTPSRNAADFCGTKLICDRLRQSGKVCSGLTRPRFKIFLENRGSLDLHAEEEKDQLPVQSSKADI